MEEEAVVAMMVGITEGADIRALFAEAVLRFGAVEVFFMEPRLA